MFKEENRGCAGEPLCLIYVRNECVEKKGEMEKSYGNNPIGKVLPQEQPSSG
jgi:hypothetical protein